MSLPNAFGFLAVGTFMEAMRALLPVTGCRGLWLSVMGLVMAGVGGWVLARAGWAWFAPRMVAPLYASFLAGRTAESADPVETAEAREAGA